MTVLKNNKLDTAITTLKLRSKRAKTTSLIIFYLLIFMPICAFGILYISQPKWTFTSFTDLANNMISGRDYSPENVFLRPVNNILNKMYPETILMSAKKLDGFISDESQISNTKEKNEQLNEVTQLINLYSTVQKNESNTNYKSNFSYIDAISKITFTVGIIGLLVFFIQICLMFIRYYAQLSEEYASQAFALEASGGDIETALRLATVFNAQKIPLGKTPQALYEKAIDTIAKVADRK